LDDIKTEERKKLERANPSLTDVKTFGDALAVLERRINNAVKLRSGRGGTTSTISGGSRRHGRALKRCCYAI